jgi:hypothetical protein
MTKLQDWLDDREPGPQWGNRDVLDYALNLGITDPDTITNAVALTEYAHFLYVKFDRQIPFDTIVNALFRGVNYPFEPVWWYARVYHKYRLKFCQWWGARKRERD